VKLYEFIENVSTRNITDPVKAVLVLERLQKIKGIGPLRAMQVLHTCCLSGLLPISCMQDHIIIASNSGPATMLRHFYGENCDLDDKFD